MKLRTNAERRTGELALLLLFALTLRGARQRKSEAAAAMEEQTLRLTGLQRQVIEGLSELIGCRDERTGAHVRRTGIYVRMLTEELMSRGWYPETVNRRYGEMLSLVAPLHDVGKIRIPDAVLNKAGPLTDAEYEIMRMHTLLGGQVVRRILGPEADPEITEMAWTVAVFHHERWDGSGYPTGKKKTEIPLCARIMAVADVFDALLSDRTYKRAMTLDQAYAELAREAGSGLQRELVELLMDLRPRVEAYLSRQ